MLVHSKLPGELLLVLFFKSMAHICFSTVNVLFVQVSPLHGIVYELFIAACMQLCNVAVDLHIELFF